MSELVNRLLICMLIHKWGAYLPTSCQAIPLGTACPSTSDCNNSAWGVCVYVGGQGTRVRAECLAAYCKEVRR
eukprot:1148842-Pelagomonas_calceolata.AAC.3